MYNIFLYIIFYIYIYSELTPRNQPLSQENTYASKKLLASANIVFMHLWIELCKIFLQMYEVYLHAYLCAMLII